MQKLVATDDLDGDEGVQENPSTITDSNTSIQTKQFKPMFKQLQEFKHINSCNWDLRVV